MSTKTSFKRIALVAVAALSLGGISAVSAHATATAPFSIVGAGVPVATSTGYTETTTASTGGYVKLTANADVAGATSVSATVTGATILSGGGAAASCVKAGSLTYSLAKTYAAGVWTGGSLLATTYTDASCSAAYGTGYQVDTVTTVASAAYLKVSTSTPGSFTIAISKTVIDGSGIATTTALQFFTVIILDAGISTAYASTTVTNTASVGYQASSTGTVYAPASVDSAIASNVTFQAVGTNGGNITNPLLDTSALTLTISGVGSFTAGAKTSGSTQYKNYPAQTWATDTVPVYGDGRAGTATISVSVGDTVVKTVKVVFYGKIATITASANYTIAYADGVGATTGSVTTASTHAVTDGLSLSDIVADVNTDASLNIQAKDSAGNVVPVLPSAYTVTSSNPAKFSSVIADSAIDSGYGDYTAGFGTGLADFKSTALTKSGDSGTLTFSILNSDGVLVTSNAVALTAGGAPATATLTADADSYAPGAKGYFTLSAKDASGNPTADDQYWANFFAAAPKVTGAFTFLGSTISGAFDTTTGVASLASSTAVLSKGQYTVGGVVKDYFYAPVGDGSWTVTATTGSDFATAGQGASLVGTVNVLSGQTTAANAATDAAQEATDAANAAYDAANNAMDSADAATAAAQDASDNASAALAAVTSLSATVAKLVSSVTAIATALAAIKKKLGVK